MRLIFDPWYKLPVALVRLQTAVGKKVFSVAIKGVVVRKAMVSAEGGARADPVGPMLVASRTRHPVGLRAEAARVGPRVVGDRTGIVLMRRETGVAVRRNRTP